MRFAFPILALVFTPLVLSAEVGRIVSIAERASDNTFVILNTYSLASAILVGLVTTALVWMNARRMYGGVLGGVLGYFASGMLVLLLAFIAGSAPLVAGGYTVLAKVLHDSLFIIGMVIMAIAAYRLSETIKGDRSA